MCPSVSLIGWACEIPLSTLGHVILHLLHGGHVIYHLLHMCPSVRERR